MVIQSKDNSKIRELKKLQMKKYRDQEGLFLVEGEHIVLEAFKSGFLCTLIVEEGNEFSLDIDTLTVSRSVLEYLSSLEHPQSIMGVCKKVDTKEVVGNAIVLDNIQDPGNLGTIIRSAAAFHIDTILLSKDTVDLYNEKVIRATQGLLFERNFIVCDLNSYLPILKQKGYSIIGTKVDGGKNIKDIEINHQFAIIVGNEGKGMREEIANYCDSFAYISMDEKCESLNVGVAASILMYELDK